MCGIFGFIGEDAAAPIVLDGLLKLEYRGYDSAGMVSLDNGRLFFKKDTGRIQDIDDRLLMRNLPGNIAMAHTRWATHGGVTPVNAHPHLDCAGHLAVVHNGIVENFQELRDALLKAGHVFRSDTDTEVIPHLLEDYCKQGSTLEEAVLQTSRRVRGSYAFMAVSEADPDKLIATRRDNPLVIGLGERGFYATSDSLSLSGCDSAVYPEEGDIVVMRRSGVTFLDAEGRPVERNLTPVNPAEQTYDKGNYAHFMLKEIMAEPQAIKSAIDQNKEFFLRVAIDILRARQVIISACGTSRYAGLVGRYLFSGIANKFCEVVMASEFHYFSESVDKNTLVIAVSQSGETADVIEGVKRAKASGARVISIVNRPNSVLCRMSDDVIYLNCGPEVAVAATKSLVSQLAVFYLLSFAMVNQFDQGVEKLTRVSDEITRVFHWNIAKLEELADRLKDSHDFYYIARGINFPIASEAALKLKEISYIHAEGLPAGELKHGTLALIEPMTPVVAICPRDGTFFETIGNGIEAKSRGAYVIGVSDVDDELYDCWIEVPGVDKIFYPLVSIAPLHLLAYLMALKRSEDPDKPRNLAKSVTVK